MLDHLDKYNHLHHYFLEEDLLVVYYLLVLVFQELQLYIAFLFHLLLIHL
jgi:hypothetical protein